MDSRASNQTGKFSNLRQKVRRVGVAKIPRSV
jgi:hypothetical protein